MDSPRPTSRWYVEEPTQTLITALQLKLDQLMGDDIEIQHEIVDSEDGTWPYVDQIRIEIYTIHTLTARAIVKWEFGQNDGSLEEWSSLTVTLYGNDQLLLDTFNTYFL